MDLDALKPDVEAIARELVASGTLNSDERTRMGKWSLGMRAALEQGDIVAVGNYRQSFSAMIGVAELRAAQASEKALLKMADVALGVIVKVALAAI